MVAYVVVPGIKSVNLGFTDLILKIRNLKIVNLRFTDLKDKWKNKLRVTFFFSCHFCALCLYCWLEAKRYPSYLTTYFAQHNCKLFFVAYCSCNSSAVVHEFCYNFRLCHHITSSSIIPPKCPETVTVFFRNFLTNVAKSSVTVNFD